MRSLAFLSVVSGLGMLSVGCVPYQTYQQTKADLVKANEANADLVKRYKQAMQKLLAKGEGTGDDGELRALLAKLQRENDDLKKRNALEPGFSQKELDDMKKLGVEPEEGGMSIGEELLFTEGSNRLKPEASRVLDEIAQLLGAKYKDSLVIIEGHTDNQPLLRTKALWRYNIRLAYERAQAVFENFITNGIPERRVVIRAYSFNKPTDPATADTKEGRAKNRRVVVRLGGPPI
jgi:flagellar motor protein MotB